MRLRTISSTTPTADWMKQKPQLFTTLQFGLLLATKILFSHRKLAVVRTSLSQVIHDFVPLSLSNEPRLILALTWWYVSCLLLVKLKTLSYSLNNCTLWRISIILQHKFLFFKKKWGGRIYLEYLAVKMHEVMYKEYRNVILTITIQISVNFSHILIFFKLNRSRSQLATIYTPTIFL